MDCLQDNRRKETENRIQIIIKRNFFFFLHKEDVTACLYAVESDRIENKKLMMPIKDEVLGVVVLGRQKARGAIHMRR